MVQSGFRSKQAGIDPTLMHTFSAASSKLTQGERVASLSLLLWLAVT
jgi:hypothetical protein